MATIRKQSIVSSIVIYSGFAVGFLNTYLFTREGAFSEAEYGLTGIFIAIGTLMLAFANLGMPNYIYKFFPYYNDHLPPRKNDQLSWALLVSSAGFVLVILAGITLKWLVVQKFVENSPLILDYYEWIFPFGFGLMIYTILEAYAWNLKKSILTNYLREAQWRLFTTILIVLFMTGVIKQFDLFIKLYAFTYPAIAVMLLAYLLITRRLYFNFSPSKVTRRFLKKIVTLASFTYGGALIFNAALVIDSIIIASVLPAALTQVAIYTLAQNISSLIQAPQRAIVAATISPLSQAWKDKKHKAILQIYQRSAINQLIFAAGIYLLIWMNFYDAVITFHLKSTYQQAFQVFLFLGATKLVDMGTGVNAQIIGTSVYWRFELISGMILLTSMVPLTYWLTKSYGIIGAGISNLISISIYNGARILFLWFKFRMLPFSRATVYTLLLAAACFALSFFTFRQMHGLIGMFIRSVAFVMLYGSLVISLKLSPDIAPVWASVKKRLGKRS